MISPTPTRQVYTVSELAGLLRGLVESALPALWIEGEVSNFRNPSGHWYFTLKDAQCQIRCCMFKGRNYLVRPSPKDGDQVRLRAQLGYYEGRGELQLVVEHLEPAGEGALLRSFEQLKAKLAAEGLFDQKLKRPLPAVPRGIGIVTSATAAALQDILTTLRRRYPLGRVFVDAVPVQGDAACPAVCHALKTLPQRAPVDVIILARGGGSLEDLWCFNHESIARAIRACAVPVVTGIGHEIDFTIADFAADLRAPTPTGAAERVAPDVADWRAQLDELGSGLANAMRARLETLRLSLDGRRERLDRAHPGRRLQQIHQRLDELHERLRQGLNRGLAERRKHLKGLTALVKSLGPAAVLARGYAIVHAADGSIVRDAAAVEAGAALEIALARGAVHATANGKARKLSS
ncbi:MAG TPA: exodeoxyribonuclease VII large subunit [Verrucomicrobiae bacterium]|nr:exodeoxyribonuclease VII large subunit [Verrucomicrobiae bacterium]